jgi:hypothetical protein
MHQLSLAFRSVRRPSAKGMTLIETCAVMAANAVLVAAVLSALYALGRADRSHSTRVDQLRGVGELSPRLRDDLHAAQTLAWDDATGVLRLAMPDDRTIVYAPHEDRWERRLASTTDADATNNAGERAAEAGELTAVFPVPSQLSAAITPATANTGEQVRIVWQAKHDADRDRPTVPTPAELSVTLGRDERILHE